MVALTSKSSIRKLTFCKQIKSNWSPNVFQTYSISQPKTAGTQPSYLLKNPETNRLSKKKYWGYQLLKTQQPDSESEPEPQADHLLDANDDEFVEVEVEPVVARRSMRGWTPSAALLNIRRQRYASRIEVYGVCGCVLSCIGRKERTRSANKSRERASNN